MSQQQDIGLLNWFGFGFNGFGQICSRSEFKTDSESIKVTSPLLLKLCYGAVNQKGESNLTSAERSVNIGASWSRRATIHLNGDSYVCLSGFGSNSADGDRCDHVLESRGCTDALINESCLTLSFVDKIEGWCHQQHKKALVWKMDLHTPDTTGIVHSLRLPLVPGGYIASKPPFFRPLPPDLQAVHLALGTEHVILLSACGTVYTWGSGSHGQLGHGSLVDGKEPRAVEALWGVPMSTVAAGGWHSACISAGGDLYIWGWNESGQLGLPSKGLKEERLNVKRTEQTRQDEGESSKDVLISVQAFPALIDIARETEITKVSCGSRHTAAISSTGNLYTWGWGNYGQLGHGSECSSDEPMLVAYFSSHGLWVQDVVCGLWNTFVRAVQRKNSPS
ncbi:RCC1 domain-containing protein 1 [Chanos chanos]|uniref:RCC1 domain-containing protein 1 n=1 Tax=Chanos chanos TaxID=29144 RepID=A0A6J2WNA8_CHACN|nr:RCC1 domain-containing protein 1 [Chanos chanos]